MVVRVVIGTMWGDEGKGKVVDYYGQQADVTVRCAGGANAGHTVYTAKGEKLVLHQIPSSSLYEGKQVLIGNGVVLDPLTLVNKELADLKKCGCTPNLVIDSNTHIILECHKELDAAIENSKGSKKVGTTKRGIGPAYATKAFRAGAVRFEDLVDEQRFSEKLDEVLPFHVKVIGALDSLPEKYSSHPCSDEPCLLEGSVEMWKKDILTQVVPLIPQLSGYIGNVPAILRRAIKDGKNILVEGAQGTLLDTDHGSYPMTTSSNSTIGGCITGSGIPPLAIDEIIGVAKAYCTRVGEGAFPTELKDEVGEQIQKAGGEFGATTGRPRRCGWQDVFALKYAAEINGLTGLAITKVDILDGIHPLKVCTGYRIDGEIVCEFPRSNKQLLKAEPIYSDEFKGWEKQDWKKIKDWDSMPAGAQDYLGFIQVMVDVPIKLVSTGPSREETIVVT